MASVFSMSEQSLLLFNQALQLKPYLVDAKHVTWVGRPRLLWVSWAVGAVDPECLIDRGACFGWIFPNKQGKQNFRMFLGHLPRFLAANLHSSSQIFTRPIPHRKPPQAPAGVQQDSVVWEADSCRLQLYNYDLQRMVTDQAGKGLHPQGRAFRGSNDWQHFLRLQCHDAFGRTLQI